MLELSIQVKFDHSLLETSTQEGGPGRREEGLKSEEEQEIVMVIAKEKKGESVMKSDVKSAN